MKSLACSGQSVHIACQRSPFFRIKAGYKIVKAYLVITGTLFGLIAVLRLLRAIAEWHLLATDPWYFLGMAGLGVLAAALAVWAWRLLRLSVRSAK